MITLALTAITVVFFASIATAVAGSVVSLRSAA
jgi:hypothetical protein